MTARRVALVTLILGLLLGGAVTAGAYYLWIDDGASDAAPRTVTVALTETAVRGSSTEGDTARDRVRVIVLQAERGCASRGEPCRIEIVRRDGDTWTLRYRYEKDLAEVRCIALHLDIYRVRPNGTTDGIETLDETDC